MKKLSLYYSLMIILYFSCNPTEGIVVPNEKELKIVTQRIATEDLEELAKESFDEIIESIHSPFKTKNFCGYLPVESDTSKQSSEKIVHSKGKNIKFSLSFKENNVVEYNYLNYKSENSEFTLLGLLKKTINHSDNTAKVNGQITVSFPHGALFKFDNFVVKGGAVCGTLDSIQSGFILYKYPASDGITLKLSKQENKEMLEKILKITNS